MGIRTVRLDKDTEAALAMLRKVTGMSISEVMKRGIHELRHITVERGAARPYDIYARIQLGKGGWAIAPAKDAKRAVREAIRRKHLR